ncbi:hypothetical protein ES705_31214 [subsurface metagenome]
MATVKIITPREQYAHFGLYRTSAGGDETIIVRRKVGEPTDYLHTASRKLKQQRYNLTLASQHYAHLSPSQKAITRHQIAEVEYQTSHGKTDTKLLMGRQLFISREMAGLKTTGKQLDVPHEVCIMLTDQAHNPIAGELWLKYLQNHVWYAVKKDEIATGCWLFSQVPKHKESYRLYGEALGYFDPISPEHQYMTETQLKACHYHVLIPDTPDFFGYDVSTFRRMGVGFNVPFDTTAILAKTEIHWGELAGTVATYIMDFYWVHYADESYYFHSAECQWSQHTTLWTGLQLPAHSGYLYIIDMPRPGDHLVKLRLNLWFFP